MANRNALVARRKARRTRLFGNHWSVLPPTALGLTLAFGAPPAWADEVIDNSSETVIGTGGGTQASPWNISGGLTVGFNNTGTLDISAGGTVSNTYSYLGLTAGSDGTVTVDGAGSKWTNSEELTVGESGTGTLSITNGGTVTGLTGYVGVYSGADGKVTVDGTDSTWTSSSGITIGLGAAGAATVSNGGTIQASGNLTLGRNSGSTGTLDILDRGTVTAGDDSFIGHRAGSDGTMNVSGDGSSFDTGSNDLFVGDEGTGALNVTNGGEVSSVASYIGDDSGSSGEVTVTGSGSRFTNSDVLAVGYEGAGTMNIADGGAVSNTDGFIGDATTSSGAVTVDGAGSTWTNSNELYVGNSGTGELTIADDGTVEVNGPGGYAFVAKNSGSTGTLNIGAAEGDTAAAAGTLDADRLVFGGGSGTLVFNHTEDSYVFGADISGTGRINHLSGLTNLTGDSSGFTGVTNADSENRGLVITGQLGGSAGYVGSTVGSAGSARVFGTGASWTATTLSVGDTGTGLLSIVDGGTASNTRAYLGYSSGATGTGSVIGTGSSWTSTNGFEIGRRGTGTLDILAGATVTSGDDSFIGHLAGSNGTMNVSGDGSSFDTGSNDLTVGNEGTGALNIENGGAVSNRLGIIGDDLDSVGTANVDGDGSTWTTSLALTVGNIGSGTLNITDSGTVNSNGGYVGINSGSDSTATVDGTGSSWTNSGFLNIGEAGTGTLNITNGGAVSDTTGQLGSRIGSNGAATVDGAGSTWTNSLNLVVGFRGAGTLTVSDGGAVSSDAGYIGYDAVSNGAVTVEGTGSTWTNSSDLYVGSEGTAELTIGDGGRVEANSGDGQVILADVSGTGTLNIGAAAGHTATGAGTLDASAVTFGDGDGTLNFNHTDTDYEFAAAISGDGAINHLAGVTTLSGVSVGYSGVTTITGGTLQIDGTLGGVLSGVQRVENGAFVIENGGVAVNLTGDSTVGTDNGDVGEATVTGVGSSWVNSHDLFVGEFGTGTLTIADGAAVSNDNAYVGNQADATGTVTVTGSTWNSNSGLYLGFDGTATLNVENGGTVGSESSVIGYRSGSDGTVTVTGAGSTWTSQTMSVGDRGNGALIVADGGEASIEYGSVGVETGTGAVRVTGAGSSLTSSNELVVGEFTTGTLTIADGGMVQSSAGIVEVGKELGGDGTLNIGAAAGETAVGAGTLDAGMVQFGFGAGTINFNHTDTDYEFAVDISRSYGSGTINHVAGITRLTGDASAFNGTTDISGGSLYVNTTLGGVVNVTGGTLGGSGTLGSVTIGSGGTLAPGNSIGTVTVNGDLALTSGSTYAVEVSPSAADQTIVTGTATIAGTLTTTYSGGSYTSGTQYTLINSTGALSGTFASVSATNLPYGFLADVSYDPNNVFLTLTQYLDSGDGQIYASGTTTAIADERLLRNAVLDHLLAPGDGMVLWGQGFGGYNKFDDGLTIGHHHSGGIAGFDLPLDNGLRAGVAAAYTSASTSISAYGGSADGDAGHVLAYASWMEGPVALRGGAALGWGSSDVTRSVSSVGETNRSDRSYRTEQIFADAGYGFDIAGASLEPHLGLEHVHASMDSFQESGGPLSSFSGDGSDASATFTTLGIRALVDGFPAGPFNVTPSLDLGWRRGFGLSRPRQSVTVDNTGQAYVFYGTPLAEDAITVKLGADIVMAPSLHLHLGYDGFLSSHSRDNAVTGKLAWAF